MPQPTATTPTGTESRTVTTLDRGSPERKAALYTGRLNPAIQSMYSLALLDTSNNNVQVIGAGNLDPARRTGAAEYFFTVPPKTVEMTEPFATTITATQNGGKFIESHGSILKTIRLTGTTGLRPNPKVGGLSTIPLFGNTIGQLSSNLETLFFQDKSIPEDEATGFDDIIFLRNLFRHYSDLKESAPNARSILMIWRNAKDADYWVVEPQEFRLSQEASSPLTYKYAMTLVALARFTTKVTAPEDPLANVLNVQRLMSRIQEYNQSLKKVFIVISTQINRLEGYGVFAQTQLLSPIINVLNGLALIKSTTTRFGTRLVHNATTLINNLNDAIEKLEAKEEAVDLSDLLHTLRRTLYIVFRIRTEVPFQDNVGSNYARTIRRVAQTYSASGGSTNRTRSAPDTGGSSSFLGNEPIANSLGQDVVGVGEDIRAIAARLIGNRSRWQVLVTLNDLKSPYISSVPRAGTLQPGDQILYPLEATQAVPSHIVSRNTPSDDETDGDDQGTVGPIQRVYGRDLRLKSVDAAGTGVDLTDLSINQSGDISTVVGIPNVDQAIRLKFLTEQGELPQHPTYGARFPIGSKATNVAFNEYRIQTEATVYSDRRVSRITALRFSTLADILSVQAKIELINAADALDTSIALRRL